MSRIFWIPLKHPLLPLHLLDGLTETLVSVGWFSDTAEIHGWFDRDLIQQPVFLVYIP